MRRWSNRARIRRPVGPQGRTPSSSRLCPKAHHDLVQVVIAERQLAAGWVGELEANAPDLHLGVVGVIALHGKAVLTQIDLSRFTNREGVWERAVKRVHLHRITSCVKRRDDDNTLGTERCQATSHATCRIAPVARGLRGMPLRTHKHDHLWQRAYEQLWLRKFAYHDRQRRPQGTGDLFTAACLAAACTGLLSAAFIGLAFAFTRLGTHRSSPSSSILSASTRRRFATNARFRE